MLNFLASGITTLVIVLLVAALQTVVVTGMLMSQSAHIMHLREEHMALRVLLAHCVPGTAT
jgi:type II secretory pathway component PulK